jgi:hypothetical protein
MWTRQQQYCTGCAVLVLLGFVLLGFYFDPTGISRLNPFGGEGCRSQEQQNPFSDQPRAQPRRGAGEGRNPGRTSNVHNERTRDAAQPSDQSDYYACRLAGYTHQLAAFTALLAVATVALIVIGVIQSGHLSRHVNAVEADSRKRLRAYVFAIQPTIDDWLARGYFDESVLMARMIIRNTGQTPAYEYRVFGGMCIRGYNRSSIEPVSVDELDYEDTGVAKGMLGPGSEREKTEPLQVSATEHRFGRAPTKEELDCLKISEALSDLPGDQPKAVFVYGEILYRDEFQTNRWTTYCFISNAQVRETRGNGMAEYKFWNQAGEEGDGQKKPSFCRRADTGST